MIVKLSAANSIAGILSGIRISRITDKSVKIKLLNAFLSSMKVVKEADAERIQIIEKFQKDWLDELKAVENLRIKNAPVVGHDEYLEAEKDTNGIISSIFDRDVDLPVEPITLEEFMDSCGNEDITFEQIAFLKECGVIS